MSKPEQIVDFMDCVFLPVADREESIRWFQEKLGLKWNGFSFDLGSGPEIMLVQVNDEKDANLTYITDHWEGKNYEMQIATFRSHDIERTHATLTERGVKTTDVKLYDGNRKVFKFYDLNGNRFEVWSGWLES